MMTDDELRAGTGHGRVLLTPRDLAALDWTGEQYGVRLDLLQVLLGRLGEREPVSLRTARGTVERWERAEVATTSRFYRELWITPTARALGGRFRVWEPAPTKMAHVHAVGVTRLAIEAAEPGAEWESERVLRQQQAARFQRARPVARVPDAAVTLQGARYGVEVELTAKTPARYAEILRQYAGHWARLVWFCPPSLLGRLSTLILAAHQDADHRLTKAAMGGVPEVIVRALPEVPDLDYRRLL